MDPLRTTVSVTISATPNGPLIVRGPVQVDGVTKQACALCRCGLSQKKPYCDNAHKKLNWTDGTPPTQP